MRERELGSTREVCRAFTGQQAFYEGRTLYGGTLTIRLGDVSGIVQNTPDTMRLVREDRIADQHDDNVAGVE